MTLYLEITLDLYNDISSDSTLIVYKCSHSLEEGHQKPQSTPRFDERNNLFKFKVLRRQISSFLNLIL